MAPHSMIKFRCALAKAFCKLRFLVTAGVRGVLLVAGSGSTSPPVDALSVRHGRVESAGRYSGKRKQETEKFKQVSLWLSGVQSPARVTHLSLVWGHTTCLQLKHP